jgi:hypothetical protein
MASRSYPNDNYAWYNDDERLAIVYRKVGSSYCSLSEYTNKSDCESGGGTWYVGGIGTSSEYDTYDGSTVLGGVRIHYHAKYKDVEDIDEDLYLDIGLDTGLHASVICYIKSRLFEDAGNMNQAQYFRAMYENKMNKYPLRKSGIRALSVPRI